MEEITATVLREIDVKKRYILLNKFVAKLDRDQAAEIVKLQQDDAVFQYVRIKCIEKFKFYDEIVEILLANDENVLESIVKLDFLFRHPSPLSEWKFFSGHILPRVSYSLRLKLLTNLTKFSRDERQLQDFFIGILNKCNMYQALPVLLCCHGDFVMEVIRKRHLNLTPKQVKKLAKKNIKLAYWYLQEIETNPDLYNVNIADFTPCLTFMIDVGSPEMFINYCQHSRGNIQYFELGIRATKRILHKDQEMIISNAEKFQNCLRKDTVCSTLPNTDLERFISALIPKKIYDFQLNQYFERMSQPKRAAILIKIFEKKYNKNLCDLNQILEMPDDLVAQLSTDLPEEVRFGWAKAQLKLDSESLDLIKLLPTIEAISTLKNLINHSENNETYLPQLADICLKAASLEILSTEIIWVFDNFSHDPTVLFSFFETVQTKIEGGKLPLRVAKIFTEKIKANAEKLISGGGWHTYNELIWMCRKCSEVFIENKHEIKDIITIYLTYLNNNCWSQVWEFFFDEHKYQKTIISTIIDLIPEMYPENSEFWLNNSNWVNSYFLESALTTFLLEPQQISAEKWQWLIEKFCQYLNKIEEEYKIDQHLKVLYKLKDKNENLQKLQLKFISEKVFPKALVKNLRKHPELIMANVEALNAWILVQKPTKRFLFNFLLQKYSRVTLIGIDQILLGECERILEDPNRKQSWPLALRVLHSRSKKDLGYISRFYPTKQKVAPDDDPQVHVTQEIIAKSLAQLLLDYKEKREVLLRFFESDFLHETLGSLYRLCTRVPIDQSVEFLETILENKVSIQKHVITLLVLINVGEKNMELFSNWRKFGHVSIKFVLFTRILKSACFDQEIQVFGSNKSHNSMDILLEILDALTKNDVDCWTFFIENSHQLPIDRFAQFYQKLFKNFNKIQFKNIDFISRSKTAMLKVLNHNLIPTLAEEFLIDLLMKTGVFDPKISQEIQSTLIFIVIEYFFQFPNPKITIFVEKFKENVVENLRFSSAIIDNENSSLKIAETFVNSVTKRELSSDDQRKVLQTICMEFRPWIYSIDSFNLVLKLDLRLMELRHSSLVELRQNIGKLLDSLEAEYDRHTLTLFAINPIVQIIRNHVQEIDDLIQFSIDFLQENDSFHVQMIVAKLLPEDVNEKLDFFATYNDLIQKLVISEYTTIQNLVCRVIYKQEYREKKNKNRQKESDNLENDDIFGIFD